MDDKALEQISGNNITLHKSKVAAVKVDTSVLVNLGKVTATHMEMGSPVSVNVDNTTLGTNIGSYTVTYKTPSNTMLTLRIDVVEEEVENPLNEETITGNHYVLTTTQVKEIIKESNDDLLITLGNVKAIHSKTHEPLAITVDKSTLKAKEGVYTVTYKTAKGTSLPLQVTVKDNTIVDETKREQISASNFTLKTSEVKGISNPTLISKAGAVAKDIDTGASVAVTQVAKGDLKAKVGDYEVTFKTVKGTSITVIASVKDNAKEDVVTKERMSGNDFVIKTGEVKNLNDAKLMVLSNVEAMDMETSLPVKVSVQSSTINAVAGNYQVTFVTDKATTLTVKVTVSDEIVENDTAKEKIYASNFTVKTSEVGSLTDDIIKDKAKVKAYNITTQEEITKIKVTKDMQAKAGSYELTFTTDKGTAITIQGIVVDESVEDTNPAIRETISGNHFTVKTSEVSKISDDKLIALGNIKARDIDTGVLLSVTVKESKVQAVAGIYDATFTTDKGTTITIKATVSDEITEDNNTKELLLANDFEVLVSDVKSLNDASIIAKAKVKAYSLITGEEIKKLSVKQEIIAVPGKYKVEFTTTANTSITVTATIKGKEDINDETKIKMSGSDFTVKTSEVNALIGNDKKLIELGQVTAVNSETGTKHEVVVIEKKLQEKPGIYDITYGVKGDTATTKSLLVLSVAVVDESVVNPDKKESITANNFTVKVSEVEGLDDTSIKDKAGVKAYDISTQKEITEITVTKDIQAKAGSYDVTFTTKLGTEITIQGIVVDESVVDPAIRETISGNHFTVKTSEANKLSDDKLIALGNIKATNLDTGAQLRVTVEDSKIQAVPGMYDVTYQTENKTKITIKVTVRDEMIEDDTKKELLVANDFEVLISEVEKGLNSATIITKASAKAYSLTTGEEITPLSVKQEIVAVPGKYKVEFTTDAGSSIIVTATVKGKEEVNGETKMSGSDFTVKASEVNALMGNDKKLIALGQVTAVNSVTGIKKEVEVRKNTLQVTPGTYDVTYGVKGELTTPISSLVLRVTVVDESIENPDTRESITANNFTVKASEVSKLTDKTVLKKADAKAFVTATNIEVEITGVVYDIKAKVGSYDVTFTTDKGTTITIQAIVVDESTGNPDPAIKETISGNHFTIKTSEVNKLSDKKLIALGNIEAKDLVTGEVLPVTVKENAIQAMAGAYDVTFTTGNGTIITIKATVSDEIIEDNTTNELLVASDFEIFMSEVESLNDASVIAKARAKAYSLISGEEITPLSVKHEIVSLPRKYKVEFTTDAGSSIIVTATVKGKEDINDETKIKMSGSDFTLKTSEVNALIGNDEKLIELGQVTAVNSETGEKKEVEIVENTLKAKPGTYDVTYGVKDDAAAITKSSLVLRVTVVDESIVNPDTKESITANNFTVIVSDVKDLTDDKILKKAEAKAFVTTTNEEVDITSVKHDIKTRVGSYPVTLSTKLGTSIVITVQVKSQDIENPDTGESIAGSNFSMTTANASKASDEDLKQLGNVKAYVTDTYEEVEVSVTRGDFTGSRGTYEVTYTTKKGTALILQVEVKDEIKEDKEHREQIAANDIYLGVEDVYGLEDSTLIHLANAKAIDLDTGKEVGIESVGHNIKALVGEYWATFTTKKGTNVKVKVFVETVIVEDEDKKERITGSAFKLDISEVVSITDKELLEKGNVKAIDTSTERFVEVQVDKTALKATSGSYPVVYTTKKGTSLTLLVMVINRKEINEEVIGNDIYLNLEEAKEIETTILLARAKARAVDINSDKEIPITIITHTIEPSKGVYEATFETEAGALLLVDVYVNNEAQVEATLGQQITGNKFTVRPEDVVTLTNETILTLGNVKAIDLDRNEFVNVYMDTSKIKAQEGTYDIALVTSKDTKAMIQVEVKKDAPVIEEIVIPKEPEVIIKKETVIVEKEKVVEEKTEEEKVEEEKVVSKPTSNGKPTTTKDTSNPTDEKMGYFMWVMVVVYGGYMGLRVYKKAKGE